VAQNKQTLDRLRSRKGITRQIPVILDGEVLVEYESAQTEFDLLGNEAVAARTSPDQHAAAANRLAAAKEALDEATVTLHLRRPIVHYDEEMPNGDTITRTLKGRLAFEHLIEANPPTDEQNAESQKEHGVDAPYNGDTFAPALISACCEDPEMTPEECDEIMAEWSLAEVMQIFTSCMDICNASLVGQMGKGYGGTRHS
jgi:hypothetical protein